MGSSVLAAETIVSSSSSAWKRRAARLLSEPIVRFFLVGVLLFVAHRLIVGDPRIIVVTPGVRAEVERRFRDGHARPPSPTELDNELRAWERDEALYREALRDHLDRSDATIRKYLADSVRGREAQAVPKRQPTDAELESWFATHRSLYETPRRYDYGTVAFAKTDRSAPAEREKYEQALKGGADPRTLGRSIVGGNLTAEELGERVGPALAAQIQNLPVGRGQRFETEKDLLLVSGERRRGWFARHGRAAQALARGLELRRAQAGDRAGRAGDRRPLPHRGAPDRRMTRTARPTAAAIGAGGRRAPARLLAFVLCLGGALAPAAAGTPARLRFAVIERDRRRQLSRPLAGQLPRDAERSREPPWSFRAPCRLRGERLDCGPSGLVGPSPSPGWRERRRA